MSGLKGSLSTICIALRAEIPIGGHFVPQKFGSREVEGKGFLSVDSVYLSSVFERIKYNNLGCI